MEQKDLLAPSLDPYGQQNLPHSTATLVLGIISILSSVCCGLGLICGIIGLVLAYKDKRLFLDSPGVYTPESYSTSKAGKVCCIIAIVLFGLVILFFVFVMSLSVFTSRYLTH